MSQPTTWGVPRDNSGGAVPPTTFASRADDSFDAILSGHKGSTAPTYAVAGTKWIDDSATPWIEKVYDGTNWIVTGAFNASSGKMQHLWYKGSDIASGATLTIPSDGNYFDVTGTSGPVTALSSLQAGAIIRLQFDASVTLTHNATSLILGGVNITTAAGDVAEFVSEGSGNWRLVNYWPSDARFANAKRICVQEVSATLTTSPSTTSTTSVNFGLSVIITPKYSDSIIEVIAIIPYAGVDGVSGTPTSRFGILKIRNTTDSVDITPVYRIGRSLVSGSSATATTTAFVHMEGRFTVNSLTPRQFQAWGAVNDPTVQLTFYGAISTATIYARELRP